MSKEKLVFLPLIALAGMVMAGCHGNTADGPPTASDKKAFLGTSDPAAQARDAARFAASQKNAGQNNQGAGAPAATH